jgi:hypothetical protein
VIALISVSLAGCGDSADLSVNSLVSPAVVLDAGIIFVDETSYLCVPFSRLGIVNSDAVVSLKSSCECVRPSIVQFAESSDTIGRALRLDVRSVPVTVGSSLLPSKLSVEVHLQLDNGQSATTKIQFLHTTRAQGSDVSNVSVLTGGGKASFIVPRNTQ